VSIEWLRDLVIVIFGLGATVAIIAMAVLAFVLYFKIKPVLKSVKNTTSTVENVTLNVEQEIMKPLVQVAAFAQGIREVAGLFTGLSRKKKGGENGK